MSNGELIFTTEVPVLVNHLNYANHLGYDSVLSILQEARMRFLGTHKLTEDKISGSIGYLITNVIVDYKNEGFHGDILKINIFVSNVRSTSFLLDYTIENIKSNCVIAYCKTTHFFYDFNCRKLSKINKNTLVDLFAQNSHITYFTP